MPFVSSSSKEPISNASAAFTSPRGGIKGGGYYKSKKWEGIVYTADFSINIHYFSSFCIHTHPSQNFKPKGNTKRLLSKYYSFSKKSSKDTQKIS